MNLSKIETKNSDYDGPEFVKDLAIPAFKESCFCLHRVGFWSNAWLSLIWPGMKDFLLKNEGKIKMIIGLVVENHSDIEFLKKVREGILQKEKFSDEELKKAERILKEALVKMLEDENKSAPSDFKKILKKMAEAGRLEVKAMPVNQSGASLHEKNFYWKDDKGNHLYANGSCNDTKRASQNKDEKMTIKVGWATPRDDIYCSNMKENYEEAWERAWNLTDDCLDQMAKRQAANHNPNRELEKGNKNIIFASGKKIFNAFERFRKSNYPDLELSIINCEDVYEEVVPDALERSRVFLAYQSDEEKSFFEDCPKLFKKSFKKGLNIFWDCQKINSEKDFRPFFETILNKMNLIEERIYKPQWDISEHQRDAIRQWKKNNFKCIFEHATGTYKTSTALELASRFLKKEKDGVVIITTPLQGVSKQWCDDINPKDSDFGFSKSVEFYRAWAGHSDERRSFYRSLKKGDSGPLIAVFVNDSILKASCIEEISRAISNKRKILFIVDEMHRWFSENSEDFIEKVKFEFVLGLSATVFNKPGEEKKQQNKKILGYFGGYKNRHSFTLSDGIEAGILSKYKYDLQRYFIKKGNKKYSKWKSGIKKEKNDACPRKVIEILRERKKVLVFCSEGSTKGVKPTDQAKIISQEINKLYSKESGKEGIISKTYHAGNKSKHSSILKDFSTGEIRVLITIRCFDEGMNVPDCDAAVFLESSDDFRQFVQRRGRILRKSKEKEDALLVDIFIAPDGIGRYDENKYREYVEKECKRFDVFAKDALNKGEAVEKINEFFEL